MFNNDINLNLYKTFYDVARFGSFSKTAEFTYSTQPSISKSIKKLEDTLNVQLFIRKPNGVELTDKGRELLFYVEKSFGNLLTAERIMLETDNLDRGKISIGMPTNMSIYVLDHIIDFHNKYPNIEITIITGNTTYLLNQLDMHKIDFIIDTSPIININNDLTINTYKTCEYCFCSLNNDNYKDKYSIEELNEECLILPVPGTTNREMLNEVLFKNEFDFNNIMNVHTSELIIECVKKNLGIGYVLFDLIKDDKKLKKVDVSLELPSVDIVIAFNKKFLTKAPEKFISLYFK